MSIDAYGKAPISENGKHFHRNVWIHFPLVAICKQLSPKVARRCKDWHSNTGDGLERKSARKLALELEKVIETDNGSALDALCLRMTWQWRYGPCPFCFDDKWVKLITAHRTPSGNAILTRIDDPTYIDIKGEILPCDCCKGIGHMRPISEDHFHVLPDDVREFARFCKDSGGFEIR
jgi:hypothetical protein